MSGNKQDDTKNRLALIPHKALWELGEVMTAGAKKYGPHNWRKGFKYTRLYSAALRHMIQWLNGDSADPETGLNHLAHACCNLMMIIEFEKERRDYDDDRREYDNDGSKQVGSDKEKRIRTFTQHLQKRGRRS